MKKNGELCVNHWENGEYLPSDRLIFAQGLIQLLTISVIKNESLKDRGEMETSHACKSRNTIAKLKLEGVH